MAPRNVTGSTAEIPNSIPDNARDEATATIVPSTRATPTRPTPRCSMCWRISTVLAGRDFQEGRGEHISMSNRRGHRIDLMDQYANTNMMCVYCDPEHNTIEAATCSHDPISLAMAW